VQGVGFRPFVHGLAAEHGLSGDIRNDSQGVLIHLFGAPEAVAAFLHDLEAAPPPLAEVARVVARDIPHEVREGFTILPSKGEAERTVAVAPDAAICADCRRELLDPADRRHRYAFINCTHCGPRYSIITDVPYDRPNTTMRDFAMCPACRAEYEDPADRRYHAQPVCCPDCGPRLEMRDAAGGPMAGDPVRLAAGELRSGRIVAVKGLGGFHLACDATNEAAVRRLRERKHREEKPFAVMVKDLAAAASLADLPGYAERLLASPVAPILIARKRHPERLARAVSPVNDYYGLMLPYTPLHVLLFEEGLGPLVMTSGNLTDEPICIANDEARDRLKGIADAFLMHNRRIHLREDDSVLLATRDRPTVVRRSRGYVPVGIETGRAVSGWAAFGPMLKNTLAVGRGTTVYPGQHVGDLNNRLALDMFQEVYDHLRAILGVEVERIACDMHPDYPSTHLAEATGLPVTKVQHHHAHLVSLMAEKPRTRGGRAIGFAFDGTGYGEDGAVWGGEVMVFDPCGYRRAFHLEYVPLPGGDRAAEEPWRMGLVHLVRNGLDRLRARYRGRRVEQVRALLESDVPMPRTSSMGRLFDAVASLCRVCQRNTYEGKAAMALEGIIEPTEESYGFILRGDEILTDGIIRGVVEDLDRGLPPGVVSGRFHNTVVEIMVECARVLREAEGLSDVFLSGGCFQNAYLLARGRARLEAEGFRVFTHTLLPPNDGGVAVGQLLAAATRGEGKDP